MKFLPAALLAVTFTTLQAADWPQWRGPSRDGQIRGEAFPEKLDALQPGWRVNLGPSYSGPIVVGDRVFVTETVDRKIERVRALDRATGKELWRHEWEGAMSVPFFAKANGDWIRSTPACDGERLYVVGMRDVLVCLDVATGKELWRFDFPAQLKTPLPDFGAACSPLVEGDSVYLQAGSGFCRLEKTTGKLVWRTLITAGGMMDSAFSSPIFTKLAGKSQLVVQTREKLAGVNPADGAVLWEQKVEAFRGMNILTPTVLDDLVFTSAYGGKTNSFRVAQADGKWSVVPAWEFKAQGNMTSPVVVDGTAYLTLRSSRALAIDVKTGVERWTTSESFGKYWSIVAQKDRLLALDERGILFLVRATPEKFEKLDDRKIASDDTWAHLAVSGRELFVRELNGLVLWKW